MLNNMSGSGEWDKRMTETLKNFDLNSPEVKQQFDQIGLTPEEVISKIMENPDVASSVYGMFREPDEHHEAPLPKRQRVMDEFNKIWQLFPRMTG
ncbi:hypothetical protein HA466_0312840 [Hirschfeldia incana]|nr:hypothetical protein HA466_0312840 [Hirschfeldia incana]